MKVLGTDNSRVVAKWLPKTNPPSPSESFSGGPAEQLDGKLRVGPFAVADHQSACAFADVSVNIPWSLGWDGQCQPRAVGRLTRRGASAPSSRSSQSGYATIP